MNIYIDKNKYYEDIGQPVISKELAQQMIKSGADIFLVQKDGSSIQTLNRYKMMDMLDCITYLIKQAKTTMQSSDTIPRDICWDAFDKLGILLREIPVNKKEFDV